MKMLLKVNLCTWRYQKKNPNIVHSKVKSSKLGNLLLLIRVLGSGVKVMQQKLLGSALGYREYDEQ